MAASSNGKTSDFDSDNPGSTPGAAANPPHHIDQPGHGNLTEKSDAGVAAEYLFWNDKIKQSKTWGAAVGAAIEFRRDAERELLRRGLDVPVK